MLSRTLRMAFWVMYDHLGKLMAVNMMFAGVLLIPLMVLLAAISSGEPGFIFFIGVPALLVITCLLIPLFAVGVVYLAKELIETRDGEVRTFFRGMREFGGRAIGIALVYQLAAVMLTTSAWFYAVKLQHSVPWLGYCLSAMAIWCLVFLGLSALLVYPALVQKKGGVRATLKLTALLVMDNPWFCLFLAIQFLALGLFAFIPLIAFAVSGSIAGVLVASAYEILARKYVIQQKAQEQAAAPSTGRRHVRAVNKSGLDEADDPWNDKEDDYLNRGFRDFVFPWKG